jgi:hypothetical protein
MSKSGNTLIGALTGKQVEWCRCSEDCPIHHAPVTINSEMLEALKQAVGQLERDYAPTPLDGHAALIRKLRATVAKAEGK